MQKRGDLSGVFAVFLPRDSYSRANLQPALIDQEGNLSNSRSGKTAQSHLGRTRMRGDDLPTFIKLLEIHRGVSHHRMLGAGKETDHQVLSLRCLTQVLPTLILRRIFLAVVDDDQEHSHFWRGSGIPVASKSNTSYRESSELLDRIYLSSVIICIIYASESST